VRNVLNASTAVRLRPDLVVQEVRAPGVVFATRPFGVTVRVAELNGDVGATATVTLSAGSTPLGSAGVTVDAGGHADATFDGVLFPEPGTARLTLTVHDSVPKEADETNDEREVSIDVINLAVQASNVLVSSLGGYGSQMNQNVYAAITGAPVAVLPDLEAKVVAQEPAIVRIYYNDAQARQFPDRLQSF
jgi:hypothetical protein